MSKAGYPSGMFSLHVVRMGRFDVNLGSSDRGITRPRSLGGRSNTVQFAWFGP